jgi:hypothetical protein
MHGSDHSPQIPCGWLLGGKQLYAGFFDLKSKAVYIFITIDDTFAIFLLLYRAINVVNPD